MISAELRASLSNPMTEEQYLEVVNALLKDATPIGAYCLGFAEALRQKARRSPPVEVMERLVKCESVREGDDEYARALEAAGLE